MILFALIITGVIVALYLTFKTWKPYPGIITLGMVAGILPALASTGSMHTAGLYVYMGFVALAFVYGLSAGKLPAGSRLVICLMSAPVFTYWLWVLNHWHGNTLLAPVLVLAMAVVTITRKAKLKHEAGFLVILASDALAIIMEHWMKSG